LQFCINRTSGLLILGIALHKSCQNADVNGLKLTFSGITLLGELDKENGKARSASFFMAQAKKDNFYDNY
jgi:hypothetical protein